MANAAVHLGMEVYGYDPFISVDAAWNLSRSIHHINDLNVIYKECDYITIHVPLMESTRKMISADEITAHNPYFLLFLSDAVAYAVPCAEKSHPF